MGASTPTASSGISVTPVTPGSIVSMNPTVSVSQPKRRSIPAKVMVIEDNGVKYIDRSSIEPDKSVQYEFVRSIEVTPELARHVLDNYNPRKNSKVGNNRGISHSRTETYARDISHNVWWQTSDLPSFTAAGDLINGQHFFSAVCSSGKSIRCLVGFGLADEARSIVDRGRSRSDANSIAMSYELASLIKSPKEASAFVNMLIYIQGVKLSSGKKVITLTSGLSFEEKINMFKTLGPACDKIAEVLQTTRIAIAPVCAVFVRAFYTLKDRQDDILRAATFLNDTSEATYVRQNDEQPLDKLSIFLLSSVNSNNRPDRWELYHKTESALNSFLDKEDLNRLVAVDSELFPFADGNDPLVIER